MESRMFSSSVFQTADYILKSTDSFSWRKPAEVSFAYRGQACLSRKTKTKYLKNYKRFKDHEGPRPSCLEFSMLDVAFVRLSSILCVTENGFLSKRNKRDSMKQNLKYIVGVEAQGPWCPYFLSLEN